MKSITMVQLPAGNYYLILSHYVFFLDQLFMFFVNSQIIIVQQQFYDLFLLNRSD